MQPSEELKRLNLCSWEEARACLGHEPVCQAQLQMPPRRRAWWGWKP